VGLLILGGLIGAWLSFSFRATSQTREAASPEKSLYVCGMHPQVIQDQPGNCPICGMSLTPVRAPAQETARAEPATLALDPATVQAMDIRTAVVKREPLRRTIRTVGAIEYDQTAITDVRTKFNGRIDKIYASVLGQHVMQGDPLCEVYSEEFYGAQAQYLMATDPNNGGHGDASLKMTAMMKLSFFDFSDDQIVQLDKTRQTQRTLRVDAPQDGFVIEKAVVLGQLVEPGTKIYQIADLGRVWVQAQAYEQDLAYIRLGQEAAVTLDYLPDREFKGRVTYIYPNVDEKARTVQVRMEFQNPGYLLKPGMFATIRVAAELEPSALLAPDMAILRSGEKATVFVALDGGRFEPRVVTLGPQAENDTYQILSGLKEGERIVTSGQFMLDSESQLREAIAKMSRPKSYAAVTSAEMMNHSPPQECLSASVKYVCPMPEHISIRYEHPGKCPICGMDLVPAGPVPPGKIAEESGRQPRGGNDPQP